MSSEFTRKTFNTFLEEKGFDYTKPAMNEGIGDIIRGVSSAISGARRGWEAGGGTHDLDEAERLLLNQMDVAIENFCRNLVRNGVTPDAVKNIRKNLRVNKDALLTKSLNYKNLERKHLTLAP